MTVCCAVGGSPGGSMRSWAGRIGCVHLITGSETGTNVQTYSEQWRSKEGQSVMI